MNGQTQAVNVQTTPAGATCSMGDIQITTPGYLIIPRKTNIDKLNIACVIEGYEVAEFSLQVHSSAWMAGNVFIGLIPGILVDAISGGGKYLEPTTVRLALKKK